MNAPGEPTAVVCAIIERGAAILSALRGPAQSNAGLWEFPGGKVQAGESTREALMRELMEELGIEVTIVGEMPEVRHSYPWLAIALTPFICTIREGEPRPCEHAALQWVSLPEAGKLPWSAADISVLENYRKIKRSISVEP
jgi:8-oxo-dGTP diphosphatase